MAALQLPRPLSHDGHAPITSKINYDSINILHCPWHSCCLNIWNQTIILQHHPMMSHWALERYGIYAFSYTLLFFCLCTQDKLGSSRLTKSLGAVAWASWTDYKWKVPVHISSSIRTPVCPELMVAAFGMSFETSHGCQVWRVPGCLMDALIRK